MSNFKKAGAMLKRLRKERGLNGDQASELIGYKPSSIYNAESGRSMTETFVKSVIDGLQLERHEALEFMAAAGMAKLSENARSKAQAQAKPEPTKAEPEMSYQEAVCFYALQATLNKKLDDFTAQMILKLLGAL